MCFNWPSYWKWTLQSTDKVNFYKLHRRGRQSVNKIRGTENFTNFLAACKIRIGIDRFRTSGTKRRGSFELLTNFLSSLPKFPQFLETLIKNFDCIVMTRSNWKKPNLKYFVIKIPEKNRGVVSFYTKKSDTGY